MALASTPGIASAEPTSGSETSGSSSSAPESPGAKPDNETGGNAAPDTDPASAPDSADGTVADDPAAGDTEQDGQPAGAGDEEAPTAESESAQDDAITSDDVSTHESNKHQRSTRANNTAATEDDDTSPPEADPQESVETGETGSQATDAVGLKSASDSAAIPVTTMAAVGFSAPPAPSQPATEIAEVADPAEAMPPLSQPGPDSPIQNTAMMVTLAAVREELERNNVRRTANVAAPQAAALLADDSPNVLVIGVDGTNLSRILANTANTNFFSVMQGGTTAAASIVGHTTISNPSWTAITTGVWGERTGVINNIFNPAVYDRWPTVFNQLETMNPDIQTTFIGDWDVLAAIADAGSARADDIQFIQQVAGDTNWSLTDDAVGDAAEALIAAADPSVPNFVFTYFAGVDENGHMHGGASQQYADAITNVDRNLGEILTQVNAWETANAEQWTIIMVTDHGHQPQLGFGHGFQSPDETSTFVIANNPDVFSVGAINLKYSIVDVTPTVITLFGGTPAAYSDGVSLTELGDSDVFPINDDAALRTALQDAIAMNGYPNIGTNLALSTRTIFASVPYFVDLFTNSIAGALQSLAEQDIFLISPLARLAILPVKIIGNMTYMATNIIAQIVARLTGVTGASIFPLLPPNVPSTFPPESTLNLATPACTAAPGTTSPSWCGDTAIAV
jgi:hypothetical protein